MSLPLTLSVSLSLYLTLTQSLIAAQYSQEPPDALLGVATEMRFKQHVYPSIREWPNKSRSD